MALIHCIYASHAARILPQAELIELLETSRANNALRDITGMLLVIEDSFFQVLEGPEVRVDEIYRTISRDGRHDRVTQIIREPIAHRSFGDWTMGFASLDPSEAGALIGENDFFNGATCLERVDAGRARKMLRSFAAGRWRTEHTGRHRVHPRRA